MTSSRSRTSRSSALALLVALTVWAGVAQAGGRKRIVVLDFEGPKAEKFHDEIVKLIKKSHTVVATDKWNGTAEELDAAKVNKKDVRKIAKKLKVDGIITGKIEKTDDSYVVQLKVRAGKTGAVVGERIETKSDSSKLDSKAKKDVTDALLGAIDGLEANHGGDDDDAVATVEPKGDDDVEPKHGGFSKKQDLDQTAATATDDTPPKKKDPDTDKPPADEPEPHHHHKKTVAAGDDDGSRSVAAVVDTPPVVVGAAQLTPGNRAVDFGAGMSFTARHLSFSYKAGLGSAPPSYKEGLPVAGGILDVTAYPFAITHKTKGVLANLGVEVMYDKVIDITSKKGYIDTSMMQQTASLQTAEDHFAIGAVFRYPVGDAFVAGAKLMYMSQQFSIAQMLPNGSATDVPNVNYGAIEPRVFAHYSVSSALALNAEAGFMFITKTGDISTDGTTGYGGSKDTGYELNLGADYSLTKAIFLRGVFHLDAVSLTFHGDANSLSNTRDTDSTTQDVFGAKDYYVGGSLQIGYAF